MRGKLQSLSAILRVLQNSVFPFQIFSGPTIQFDLGGINMGFVQANFKYSLDSFKIIISLKNIELKRNFVLLIVYKSNIHHKNCKNQFYLRVYKKCKFYPEFFWEWIDAWGGHSTVGHLEGGREIERLIPFSFSLSTLKANRLPYTKASFISNFPELHTVNQWKVRNRFHSSNPFGFLAKKGSAPM